MMTTSGRGVYHPKATVHASLALDLLTLQRNGLLRPGANGSSFWTCAGRETDRIAFSVGGFENEPTLLWLQYSSVAADKTSTYQRYWVKIGSTPCHFGRQRFWFTCPLIVNGRPCERRCRILYLPPGAVHFGCRECHRLTYDCRRKHRDFFYENIGKHEDALKKLKTFKPPRSPAQWVRRYRRTKTAQTKEWAGWAALDAHSRVELARSEALFRRFERRRALRMKPKLANPKPAP